MPNLGWWWSYTDVNRSDLSQHLLLLNLAFCRARTHIAAKIEHDRLPACNTVQDWQVLSPMMEAWGPGCTSFSTEVDSAQVPNSNWSWTMSAYQVLSRECRGDCTML